MTRLIFTGEGATVEAHGFDTHAPSLTFPLFLPKWLEFPERIEISHLVYYTQEDWTRDEVVKIQAAVHDAMVRENTDLLERAKSAERAVANLRAKLAGLTGTTDPAEPPNTADVPTEIPISELRASLEFSRADHQRTIQRSIVLERERDEAKQESVASQALWHGVSNECEKLRTDIKRAEERYERVCRQLVARTEQMDQSRKELEELRTRMRNSLRTPAGDYKP